jgi:hypothetical protein
MTKPEYPKTIVAEHFDPELYDLYWRMIAERQRMYVRRALLGMPRPWTEDKILSTEFITNMYRELDPGTQYVITQLLTLPKAEDRVFNVLMYRLMGSNSEAFDLIRGPVKQFKQATMLAKLNAYSDAGGKIFGDAYRVAGYETEGGSTKIENISLMFGRIAKEMPDIMGSLKAATNPREGFDVIKSLSGFGEFLAHQITVDLLYSNEDGQAVLPGGEDTWAQAGPGARNGIWAMLKPNIKPRNLMMVMQFLRDAQEEEFDKRGIAFPYLADADGNPIHLSICNIQSTLCEFFKYSRLWDGSTKSAVRRYIPSSDKVVPTFPVILSAEEVEEIRTAPSLMPPAPVGGRAVPALAEQPEPALEAEQEDRTISVDEYANAEITEDVKGYDIPAEFSFTTPSGQAVHITININLGTASA